MSDKQVIEESPGNIESFQFSSKDQDNGDVRNISVYFGKSLVSGTYEVLMFPGEMDADD